MAKCRTIRRIKDAFGSAKLARSRSSEPLPALIYRHNSLIRRRLGNADMQLQENKAHNLALAAPRLSGVLIRPGETFSFWTLVGEVSAKRGYRDGVTITNGRVTSGAGGGMCQFTNLIHWMVLHSPLTIVEHHHHDGMDLFPDYGRQVPFGTGTSIMFNYLDYRVRNDTDNTFQIVAYTTDEYLCGELRALRPLDVRYHVKSEGERFVEEGGVVYREGSVYRECVDKRSGNLLSRELIKQNHARVMYDTSHLHIDKI